MPSATSFFCAPKKMKQKKGAPAGGLHSTNRFWNLTKNSGLQSWMDNRQSGANRSRALCVMACLKYCVTSVINTKDTHSYRVHVLFTFCEDQRPRISRSLFSSLFSQSLEYHRAPPPDIWDRDAYRGGDRAHLVLHVHESRHCCPSR